MALSELAETADIETSSDGYARRFSGELGAWFLAVQEEATLAMLAPHRGASVLDVGGGHGQLTPALARQGYQVTVLGSDEVCRTRIQELLDNGQCQFRVGNLLHLPYSDRTFDVAVSFRLLSHVSRWRRFLAELTRVAREAVILDFPSVGSMNALTPVLFRVKRQVEENTRSYRSFREAELVEAFAALGFEPADRYPQFFLPMVLHRVFGSR
ncbi:MAG: methyltransferase domain-containing protein, partial [Anaerolineae bacterium]|nr:methyltransferase domain-containing protein [Anaerolineae bacterium]NIN96722.1 methyltransferase domain-containing protein [Anaerolineae bacterium]